MANRTQSFPAKPLATQPADIQAFIRCLLALAPVAAHSKIDKSKTGRG